MTGPPGTPRSPAKVLLLSVLTLGIYGCVWTYRTHQEIRRHTGEGMGGTVGVVLLVAIGVITPFALPDEIRRMYEKAGQSSPVRGATGLWVLPGLILLVGPVIWLVKVQRALNDYWESLDSASPSVLESAVTASEEAP